ncbi:MAG: UbiA prenyltransferase family protein [Candidatus Woesearchaeota archaeon]
MKYIALLRPQQWYKNLLVFLALVFSRNLMNISALEQAAIAFLSFCALSSATYIINDYADRNKDRLNPEKINRPLASGKISVLTALGIALILIITGFGTAFLLPTSFLYAALAYFVLSQLYTAWLKYEAFADILVIATNFVIRAMAGAFAIDVPISPWLILGVFFLALFLLLGKRRSEIMLLKEKAILHRKTLDTYSIEIVARLSSIATAALVLSYTLFVFFGQHHLLYITLPIALYAIFRYDGLISSGSKIARHPEYAFADKKIIFAMLLWGALTVGVLYF